MCVKLRRLLSLLLGLALGIASVASGFAAEMGVAGPCAIPGALRITPPQQENKPVTVDVGVVIVDLFEVNDGDQTFRADIVFTMRWRDPRLSARARGGSLANCRLSLKQIWHPDVRVLNLRAQFRALGETVRIADDGTVRHEKQVLGQYSVRFLMRDFPFDKQELRARLASFSYGPRIVRLVPGDLVIEGKRDFSVAGWRTLDNYADDVVKPLRVGVEEFSRLDHVILVQREPEYFLWNFVLPLVFIVLMAWTVFWLNPESWGAQIGIATASAFTLVAFLIALRTRLPPVPYLTRLDELILGSTILVFFALGQVIVTSRLAQTERIALAQKLDAYGRWIYIVLFAGIIYMTLIR